MIRVDKAAATAHEAAMVRLGQYCAAGTRIFVEAPVYEDMVSRLKLLTESCKVGNPFECDTIQGPQVHRIQFDNIMSHIKSGIKEWAGLVAGGSRIGEKGFYIQPTTFADVTDEMFICREDISGGPIQLIIRFETVEEVIRRANTTTYGLGARVFTNDMDKAMCVAQNIRAASFWVNCYNVVDCQVPFGGYKMSGFGRAFDIEGIDCYMETKIITTPIEKDSCSPSELSRLTDSLKSRLFV